MLYFLDPASGIHLPSSPREDLQEFTITLPLSPFLCSNDRTHPRVASSFTFVSFPDGYQIYYQVYISLYVWPLSTWVYAPTPWLVFPFSFLWAHVPWYHWLTFPSALLCAHDTPAITFPSQIRTSWISVSTGPEPELLHVWELPRCGQLQTPLFLTPLSQPKLFTLSIQLCIQIPTKKFSQIDMISSFF